MIVLHNFSILGRRGLAVNDKGLEHKETAWYLLGSLSPRLEVSHWATKHN